MPGLPTINLNNMSADDVTCYEATASEKADISEALQGVDQWNWSVLALHEASAQHGLQVLESRGSLSLGLPPPSLLVHPPLSHTLQLLSLRSQQAVPEFMTEHVCTTRCWGGIFLKPGACLMS
jgi:hypothetical protein